MIVESDILSMEAEIACGNECREFHTSRVLA